MKAFLYILFPILFILSSCAPTLYTGAENDDLYYSPSDKPVVNERAAVNNPIAEKELKANNYYDNVYAADTLVTDKYSVPSDYDDQIVSNNNNPGSPSGSGYDYYDDSYSNRINMFYGNYFNPYWQDPFYFSYGYPYGGLSFGFNMGFGFGFGFGYGYGYGYPYYGYPYYGYPYYGYGYGGYYPYYPYYGDAYHSVSYGRRDRPSTMSSSGYGSTANAGYARRSGTYATSSGKSSAGGQTFTPDSRRSASGMTSGAATARSAQDASKGGTTGSMSVSGATRSQSNVKPDYKSANRTYTPSYNNPRMSTRPSYNNSRISGEPSSGSVRSSSAVNGNRTFGNTATVRNSPKVYNQGSGSGVRSNSFSNMQRKYSTPSGGSTRSYSMPSRRSAESSGSSSRSFSSPSSGSSSSGSFSRSSSSGSSGGSFSGSSGRSSGGGGSHSSGGRR